MELGKILVSGATGYLGSNLVNSLLDLDLSFFDRTLKMNNLDPSLRARSAWQSRNDIVGNFDTVIHAAHFNDLEAELEFINLFSPDTYFVFFSSAAVYGETDLTGVSSSHKPAPINDYGLYKLRIEDLVKSRFAKHLILRIANPYAGEPILKGVYQIFKSHIEQGLALNINADKQGAMIRDFIHINKFLGQIKALLLNKSEGYFNISSGQGKSLEDFTREQFPQSQISFNYLGFRQGEIRVSVLNPG